MKINNSVFFNPNFIPAFQKLITFDFDAAISVRLYKTMKVLEEQLHAVNSVREKLLKDLCVTDEQNNIIFKDPESKEYFEKQLDELVRDQFDIPLESKIKLSDSHQISVINLEALDSIVSI